MKPLWEESCNKAEHAGYMRGCKDGALKIQSDILEHLDNCMKTSKNESFIACCLALQTYVKGQKTE